MTARLRSQLRNALPIAGPLYLAAVVLLVAGFVVSARRGFPFGTLTRDPAAIVQVHPFTGLLSNLGALLWAASAAICFLAAGALRRRSAAHGSSGFFLGLGLLTVLLLLDDLFLLHDFFLPRHWEVGEAAVFSVYGLLVGIWMAANARIFMETDFLVFLLALAFFALSLLVDFSLEGDHPWRHLLEDGPKLLGITGWLAYAAKASLDAVAGINAPSTDVRRERDREASKRRATHPRRNNSS